ncbi:golgin candidate 2 [Cornus florida]|uniref:golgin candidate 2 n=1 Tax=Cornus florida TaxID=4283 RepID=UPI0028976390|nr:golgin candidate 2 [Cornus florida]
MANWISSKLKVAETLLHQIDQQAADSLRKNDKQRSDESNNEILAKTNAVVPLKDQLKKKTEKTSDLIGKLHNDHNSNVNKNNSHNPSKEIVASVNFKPSSKPKPGLSDSDWTELLSAPSQTTPPTTNRGNGVSGIRSLRKDGRRPGGSGSNLLALEAKRNHKTQNSILKSSPKSDVALQNKINSGGLGGRPSDGEDSRLSDSMGRTSSVELQSNGKHSEGRGLDQKDEIANIVEEHKNEAVEGTNVVEEHKNEAVEGTNVVEEYKNEAVEGTNGVSDTLGEGGDLQSTDRSPGAIPHSTYKKLPSEMVPVTVDEGSYLRIGANDDANSPNSTGGINEYSAGPRSSASLKRGSPSVSDGGSASETDSASTSDSESERDREERRRRRDLILAEKAAAKAVEAIRERENMVARLEGEKQSLEKILEERAKQQAQEASELQTTTMEMMEAVELEKQKHNNTRMEALGRLAKLETANADLARSLATAQWNLEVEVNRVSELRQQTELKEAIHEELRRKILNSHQTGNKLVVSKGVEFEREILEEEYSFITDKVGRLQEKAKTLETNIKMTQKEMENPTEVEIELKRRLGQLTNHLIQKQSQVEALSSEKATLMLRIETSSKFLEENDGDLPSTSSRDDLESGILELPNSKLKERIRSGQRHLGSLVQQLDSIFCFGAVFLRRNPTARSWCIVYLVCLHLWVAYILMSHSPVSDEARSGAVISLQNINNTGGSV